MSKLAFFWLGMVRIICSRQSSGGGKFASETREARAESGHCGKPPKAARFQLGIDHSGARIKAHMRGAFGPDFFVLTAGE